MSAPYELTPYGEAAVDRVVLIRRLFEAGLTSRTMADLLRCSSADGPVTVGATASSG